MHAQRGGKMILSPGPRAYLDMKYDSATVLGLKWAGLIDLRTAYDWDPATLVPGVGESSILGLEAPLWAETFITRQDYEFMAFPRASRRSPSWRGRRRRRSAGTDSVGASPRTARVSRRSASISRAFLGSTGPGSSV